MDGSYREFLERKAATAPTLGVEPPQALASHLFGFQADAVRFGVRVGSWGCFFDTGLGKTACELEWSKIAAGHSNGRALILAPLAVGQQIAREGERWGYDARVIRDGADARDGISVCNYDRLHRIDPGDFGAVVLDESSILKSFTGSTCRALISAFASHRWRMSATATPAPNDHIELANQCSFLGAMTRDEMLQRFFVHDSADTKSWRLKGHARRAFWDWMASWSRMASHPRDLGDDVQGFDLQPLRVHRHEVDGGPTIGGGLFGIAASATEMHSIKRQTIAARADRLAEVVAADSAPWLVWCDTNYEADAITARLADAVEVRGSHSPEQKEAAIMGFIDGGVRVLVTKPSICGFGLNLQHCSRMAFVGRTFSYESYYQAVRRCWRFGQNSPVDVHLIVADGEDSIARNVDRKAEDHATMKREMVAAMRRSGSSVSHRKVNYAPSRTMEAPSWIKSRA